MKKLIYIFITSLLFIACSDGLQLDEQNHHIEDNVLAPYKMTRAEAMNLILSHGVGYGYNGIDGEECNVPDVRSQVLEPTAIFDAGITVDINKIEDNKVHFSCSTGFSLNELLEKVYFGGNGSAELAVMFKGSIRGTLLLYSQKKINSFYCTANAYKNGLYSMIDGPSVSAVIDSLPEMLTKNFRSAIARLGKNPTKMQMDSLISRYGTHVVTKCTLGGMMQLDVRLEKDSIVSISRQDAIGEVALMSLFNHDSQSSNDEYDLKIINSGDSRLTVRGGDSRKLEQTLMNFNWGRDAVKPQDVDDWLESIGTDEDKRQTLEMTSMEMMPIWEFIPDPDVARQLEAHITGNAQLMFDLYGYQNFVNTSFTGCPYQQSNDEQWFFGIGDKIVQKPAMPRSYNIEAGGRYVASMYYELIPEIDLDNPVWVAYPIYQQQVNISTGLCIHNGKAYRVGWRFGEMVVTPIPTESVTDRIYMTGGYLYPLPTQGIEYEESRLIIGYEWPGSIKTDGTLDDSKQLYTTYKDDNLFFLCGITGMEQYGQLSALPNWTFNSDLNRMVRDDYYNYYYNPLEVTYINSHPDICSNNSDKIYIRTSGWLSGKTSKTIVVTEGVNLTLSNANINNNIIIDGNNASLTLGGANISGQINCLHSTTITLQSGTTNTVYPIKQFGKAGIRVTAQLKITGDGVLEVFGSAKGAGIGSNYNEKLDGGDITIEGGLYEGGKIDVVGGDDGAGIGAGAWGEFGQVTIFGANVKAKGGTGAAGIGSGSYGSTCNLIKIVASKVVALGGKGAAGIGSGKINSRCETILLGDSDIEAYGVGGAGIGSGIDGSSAGNITIEGSNIFSQGLEGGAGIGGGRSGGCWGISLSKSDIEANSKDGGAAIGSGSDGSYCEMIMVRSANVFTCADWTAAAVGSGYKTSSCGKITIERADSRAKPPVIEMAGSHIIGAGEESTCGSVYIDPETVIR